MFNSLTFSNIEFFAGGGLSVGGEEGQDGRGGDQVSQMELSCWWLPFVWGRWNKIMGKKEKNENTKIIKKKYVKKAKMA